jgi:hypothetical protein
LDERRKKAFDFAKDVTVQLITLATGIIAIEVTLLKDVLATVSHWARLALFTSWIAFLFSVALGVMTILALTGTLEPKPKEGTAEAEAPPSIRGKNVTIPSGGQIFLFVVGLLLTIVFGGIAIWSLPVHLK